MKITQADKLKELVSSSKTQKERRTKFLAITSGKGGVGKSTIAANLGYVLHNFGFKVGVFDADIGLANLDVLLKINAKKNVLDVFKGEAKFKDIVIEIEKNFYLIPGENGDEILKYSNEVVFERFLEEVNEWGEQLDFLVIDTGAGIGREVQTFLNASDEVIVITVPEPAAITDAYAMIKMLSEKKDRVFLLMNEVDSPKEANTVFQKIIAVAKDNIKKDFRLQMIGYLKKDKIVKISSIKRQLFVKEYPFSQVTEQLTIIAKKIVRILERKVLVEEEKGISRFFKRILGNF